jgi:hypothetical protein
LLSPLKGLFTALGGVIAAGLGGLKKLLFRLAGPVLKYMGFSKLADGLGDGIDIIDSDGNRTKRPRQPRQSGNIEERYNRAREEARIREQRARYERNGIRTNGGNRPGKKSLLKKLGGYAQNMASKLRPQVGRSILQSAGRGLVNSVSHGKLAIGGLVAGIALGVAEDNVESEEAKQVIGLASDVMSYASMGAMVGSVIPGVGNVVGGVVGALTGLVVNQWGNIKTGLSRFFFGDDAQYDKDGNIIGYGSDNLTFWQTLKYKYLEF